MALPSSWPVLVPCAHRAPAPVNQGVDPRQDTTNLSKPGVCLAAAAVPKGDAANAWNDARANRCGTENDLPMLSTAS